MRKSNSPPISGNNFNNYFNDELNNPKTTLLKLLPAPTEWEYDVIVIESIIGNGATHLLNGVLHEIKKQGKNAIYVSGERLFSGCEFYFKKNVEKDSIDEPIVNAEYFLLDSYSFIELNTERFELFILFAHKLIDLGIKLVVSTNIGYSNLLLQEFKNHLLVTSNFPSDFTIRRKILSKYEETLANETSLFNSKAIKVQKPGKLTT